ncbi:hypothetical protein, partial [Pseudonocardia xinjiangensis]|uniref:hypothetical protein n=1 Tax=Pseudonocardia xinjiangensis TaxID=75289 RepID=UPI0031D2648B
IGSRVGGGGQRVDRLDQEAMGGGERAVRHPTIILEHMFESMFVVAGQRPFSARGGGLPGEGRPQR